MRVEGLAAKPYTLNARNYDCGHLKELALGVSEALRYSAVTRKKVATCPPPLACSNAKFRVRGVGFRVPG